MDKLAVWPIGAETKHVILADALLDVTKGATVATQLAEATFVERTLFLLL